MKKILILLAVITFTAIVGGILDICIIGDALSSLPQWKRVANILVHDCLGFIVGGTMMVLYKPWT